MRDPYSLEAEHGVLGAMMQRPDLIDVLADDLKEKDFFFQDNREVFKAIVSLNAIGGNVDFLTVAEKIGTMPGGGSPVPYCGEIVRNTPSVANAQAYARIVKDRSVDRDLVVAAETIHELAFADRAAVDKLTEAQASILNIDAQGPQHEVVTAEEVVDDLVQEWYRRAELDGQLDGLSTGLEDLDRKLHGLKGGQLIVIAGRAKMGKTTFAMGIAAHNALEAKKNVLVVSLEMSNRQLLDRMASSIGTIPLKLIKSGQAMNTHPDQLSKAATTLKSKHLRMSDRAGLSMTRIRAMARRHKRSYGLDLLVIDHLGLVDGEDRGMNSLQRTSEATRLAKLLARELNVPVLLLCQLNRALEQRPNKRPIPSDLRESGTIEQDADLVIFVYRDEVYHPDTQDHGVAEIIIGLGRDVEPCTVRVAYEGKFNRFKNLADSDRPKEAPPSSFAERYGERGMAF